MKAIKEMAAMNANSIEKKQMGNFFGGTTMNTWTVPCTGGGHCDGADCIDVDMKYPHP
ncbi:MAG: TIGR04149 family rSAM-modified RiPP [Bacteroidales bacterium]|nr:TIGR04149 family rSAM-modified RiPP [Bacteroidales bacterium]